MANHGWVKSKKVIPPELVSEILDELNKKLFKGNLQIEYSISTPESPGYGEHTWVLRYVSEEKEWASRVCWLDTPKKFEMRHGGGSKFAWWIDTAILNEVAVRTNGTIYDDGDDEKSKGVPNKFDTFKSYLDLDSYQFVKPEVASCLLNFEKQHTPKEFHDQFELAPDAEFLISFHEPK